MPRLTATALLLVGGRSRRMGQDKALLLIDGQPLIARNAALLTGWFDQVLLSADRADRYPGLGLEVVVDQAPGQGPLMGIASGLAVARHELVFAVACDVPRIDRALVEALLSEAAEVDAVIPENPDGLVEPLFAVYRRGLAAPLLESLAAGTRRILEALAPHRVRYRPLKAAERIINLNTPADLRAFLEGR